MKNVWKLSILCATLFALGATLTSCDDGDTQATRTVSKPSEPTSPPPSDRTRNRFDVVHELTTPIRIAQGADGTFYVTDYKANAVFILDENLTVTGELQGFNKPLGIAVDGRGNIYVGNDGKNNVEVYTRTGRRKREIDNGRIGMPNDIALDSDGNVYVADSASNMIRVYDRRGHKTFEIGGGEGSGSLLFPVAVAVRETFEGSERPQVTREIFVADQRNKVVKVYDAAGTYLRTLNGVQNASPTLAASTDGPGIMNMGMFRPKSPFVRVQGLTVTPQGELHVLDSFTHQICVIDPVIDGVIRKYGSYGKDAGQLNLPLGIAATYSGRVAIANYRNARIDVLDQN